MRSIRDLPRVDGRATPVLPISTIKVGRRFRRDLGDIDALARNIEEAGLLHPVVIDQRNRLVAGRRRLEALRLLGRDEIPVHVVPLGDIARGEFAENVIRKNFTPSEMVAIAEALEPREKEAAKERRKKHGGTAPGRKANTGGKLPAVNARARDNLARAAGVCRRTLEKAQAVVEAAREEPGFAHLVAEMDRTGRVHGAYRKLVVARQAVAIRAKPPPLPDGPFDVIVIDPPWRYEPRDEDASHAGATPYATMSIEAIAALPVARLAGKDAVIWLWTTNTHIPHAFGIVAAWGCTYKTLLTWDKQRGGMGRWLRGQTEHALLCVRGDPTFTLSNQTTLLAAKRGKHSEKPDELYALVESLCPGSKLEMFARKARPGWARWGLEAPPA